METAKTTVVALATLVLIGLVLVVGWQFGWWLKAKNVDRGARIDDRKYNRQSALQEEVIRGAAKVADLDVTVSQATASERVPLLAQRHALVAQTCDQFYKTTGTASLPTYVREFVAKECK